MISFLVCPLPVFNSFWPDKKTASGCCVRVSFARYQVLCARPLARSLARYQ